VPEQSVYGIIDSGIVTQFREITAHEREIVIVAQLTNSPDPLNGPLFTELATQRISGVCGVRHYAATLNDRHRSLNQP
jgi:hypothetical protein